MLWGGEWTGNIQIDCVDIRDGVKILWNNLNGKRIWKRMDTCVGITESLCCTPVTNTSLEINYTLVLKKKRYFGGQIGAWSDSNESAIILYSHPWKWCFHHIPYGDNTLRMACCLCLRVVRGSCKVTMALETSKQMRTNLTLSVLLWVIIHPSKGPRTYILSSIPATAPTIMFPFNML